MKVGIIGGLGPIASAYYLSTLCNLITHKVDEHHHPKIYLLSDPSLPKGNNYYKESSQLNLEKFIADKLHELVKMGVDHIIICCMAAHAALDHIPEEMQRKIITLTNSVEKQLKNIPLGANFLCAQKTKELNLFDRLPKFKALSKKINYPCSTDQIILNESIQMVKAGKLNEISTETIKPILARSDGKMNIVACSELHVIFNHFQTEFEQFNIFDPFLDLANTIVDTLSKQHTQQILSYHKPPLEKQRLST